MQQRPTELPGRLEVVLAALFIVYGLLATACLSVGMPPFQNADEANHAFRAEQLSRLQVLPSRMAGGVAGGTIDSGVIEGAIPYLGLPFHPERKATRALFEATAPIAFTGSLVPAIFPNTAIYPPPLYLPAIAGLWAGKAAAIPVIHTLYLSRAFNGICATALAATAIALSGGAALALFAVLTLPMTLSLFAAVSQDGMMIAFAALAAALLATARVPRPLSGRRFALLCLALALICIARPPYAPLACLVLLTPWRRLPHRMAALALIAVATLGWSLIALNAAGIDVTASTQDIDPKRQIAFLLAHPSHFLAAPLRTVQAYRHDYMEQFVGRLGWLDTPLPALLHTATWIILALAAAATAAGAIRARSPGLARAAAAIACALAAAALIFAIQYLTFSPVGSPRIEGVQGRYFIPPMLILAGALAAPRLAPGPATLAAAALIGLYPVFSIAQMLRAILLRYYL